MSIKKAAKPGHITLQSPGFFRRLAAIMYDLFLLLAVLFVATAILLPLNAGKAFTSEQYFYPTYLLAISFGFYGWFWTHGGQTLGLRAWGLRVQTFDRQSLSWSAATIRFACAIAGWSCLGIGFFWMLFDKQHYTWYDYCSKSTLYLDKNNASSA